MKKLLVLVLLIDFSTATAGEMPRQMLFVNLPDLAQQKLSVSFLNRTKQNNYWQFDAAFRQIYTYEKFYSYKGETEPRFIKPFSSSMGFHLFINAGLKIVKSRKGDADITKYWQPNFCLKYPKVMPVIIPIANATSILAKFLFFKIISFIQVDLKFYHLIHS